MYFLYLPTFFIFAVLIMKATGTWDRFLQVTLFKIDSTLQYLFDVTVHITATFMAAVLSHPAVEKAAADTVVEGMNRFLTQSDLDKHMRVMTDTMARSQGELAAKAGQDFPKIVGSFLTGLIMPPKKDSKESPTAAAVVTSSTTSTVGTSPVPDRTVTTVASAETTTVTTPNSKNRADSQHGNKLPGIPLLNKATDGFGLGMLMRGKEQ
jgi:hypothetical protein